MSVFARIGSRCLSLARYFGAALALATAAAVPAWAAHFKWDSWDPAEFAQTAPASDPDASAVILDWRIRVDDSDRPSSSTVDEYVRYKIFDPERAAPLTRISQQLFSVDGSQMSEVDVTARLTKLGSSPVEFGKDALQERELAKNGSDSWVTRVFGSTGVEVKEKYLAVPGVEPGSVLEFHVSTRLRRPGNVFTAVLQREGIPVRRVTLEHRLASPEVLVPYPLTLNSAGLHFSQSVDGKDTGKTTITLTGTDLPGYVNEPFQGPLMNRSLTYILSYRWRNLRLVTNGSIGNTFVDAKLGPWANLATVAHLFEDDQTEVTRRIRKLEAEITQGAATDLEKARRIHQFVQVRYGAWRKAPKSDEVEASDPMATAEEVADADSRWRIRADETSFLHLAEALYKAAGFPVQQLLLPRNDRVQFSKRMVSDSLLQDGCLRVQLGGSWFFSKPVGERRSSFGDLPWFNRGAPALIAQDRKEEFVDIPEGPASESVVTNKGRFELAADGSLTGRGTRTLTGVLAWNLRGKKWSKEEDSAEAHFRRIIKEDLKADSVEVTSVRGIDDEDGPVTVEYTATIPDYAEATRERLIFKANVFHGNTGSPFPADTRRNLMVFPWHWTEVDDVSIHIPDGYGLESPSAPASIPGPILSYKVSMGFNPKTRDVVLHREFFNNADLLASDSYPKVKHWFDGMARGDAHELVLLKSGTPAPAAKPAAPAAGSK